MPKKYWEKRCAEYDTSFYKARVKAGLTQDQASEISGVNKGTIQGWEKGIWPQQIRAVRAVAKAYGCTLGELVGMEVLKGKSHE